MEKITNKQFFLIVNGPSCGGKSTVSNYLCEHYGGIFKAKGDHIKWLISDYDASLQRGIVHDMTLEMIKIALKNGLSVLKEGALFQPEKYFEIAQNAGVPIFVANVSAPEEVLWKRFEERIERKKQGEKIANTNPERFNELYHMYLDTKIDTPLSFDSSQQHPAQISDSIVEYIRGQ